MERSQEQVLGSGSKDGSGAADNDQPYTFGRRPRAIAPWPFTERQFAHLLIMRGRLADSPNPADRADVEPIALFKRDSARKPRRKAA